MVQVFMCEFHLQSKADEQIARNLTILAKTTADTNNNTSAKSIADTNANTAFEKHC